MAMTIAMRIVTRIFATEGTSWPLLSVWFLVYAQKTHTKLPLHFKLPMHTPNTPDFEDTTKCARTVEALAWLI